MKSSKLFILSPYSTSQFYAFQGKWISGGSIWYWNKPPVVITLSHTHTHTTHIQHTTHTTQHTHTTHTQHTPHTHNTHHAYITYTHTHTQSTSKSKPFGCRWAVTPIQWPALGHLHTTQVLWVNASKSSWGMTMRLYHASQVRVWAPKVWPGSSPTMQDMDSGWQLLPQFTPDTHWGGLFPQLIPAH